MGDLDPGDRSAAPGSGAFWVPQAVTLLGRSARIEPAAGLLCERPYYI